MSCAHEACECEETMVFAGPDAFCCQDCADDHASDGAAGVCPCGHAACQPAQSEARP